MTPYLQCRDPKLALWLLSNPSRARKGVMLLICNGLAFDWPIVADNEGRQRGTEAA